MRTLTEVIKDIRNYYILEGFALNERDINTGTCVEFAELVAEQFYAGECEVISNDHFILDGWNGDGKDFWDENWLQKYGSMPPKPFTVESLAKQIKGYHCWIYHNEKHYDAECPDGVQNMFDLPFFQRHLIKEV